MKKLYIILLILAASVQSYSQVINVTGVTSVGRFNSCSGNNTPVVTATLISTSGGAIVSGGMFTCLNPCDTSTIRVNLSNVKWNKNPNAEWLHGLFLPANAGFSVSPVFIPTGFITYNSGCVGMCASGSGVNGGPGFYFDNTFQNTCCGTIPSNDGLPCNNYGDVSIGCNSPLSLTFDITFCNSIITSSSYQFVFTGSSDGETGCYNFNDGLQHHVTFTIPTAPCVVPAINASATSPVRSCNAAGVENFTTTLTGTCSGNNINWWDAPTGGNLLFNGSPYVYDPAGSACPAGTTLYATCCTGLSTTCVQRTAVTVPGSCNPLTISGVTSTNTFCSTLGSINAVNVLYSQGTVNYTLTPGGITNTSGVFTGLNQTSYTVTVSDASNCTASTVVPIVQVPVLSINAPSLTNVTCSAPSSGQIVITSTGGAGGTVFSIVPAATQTIPGTFTGLTAQTYTITATDISTCSVTTVVTLLPSPLPVLNSVTPVQITCNGLNNGSVSAVASGGTGLLTYSLLPGAASNTSGIFTNLTAQTYTIKATDANGCTATSVFTINNPPLLTWASVAHTNTTCSYLTNGTINALSSGGTPLIQYTLLPVGTTNSTGIFNALSAGNYTVKATDANGCSITSAVNIGSAPAIVLGTPVVVAPLCNAGTNGSITVTASGGTGTLTFTLNPGGISNTSGSFTSLTAGNYTITVTDNNTCSTSTTAIISQPAALVFTSAAVTNLLCNAASTGTLSAVASGGTGTKTFLLQPGGATNTSGNFTGLSAQTYTIKVTDAQGCTKTSTAAITQPAAVTWTSTNKTNVLCNGGNTGAINVSANGGTGTISYTLQPGGIVNTSGTYSSLTAQSYTVTASDVNGCSVSTTLIITQPPLLTWTSVTKTNVNCNGGNNGSITALATGGTGIITYTKTPGATSNTTGIFGTLTAQLYTITATDANACSISTIVTITQPTLLLITNVVSTPLSCAPANNASITITGSGGVTTYQYSIGGPNQVSNVFNGLGAGTYTVKITDANGCTKTDVTTISPPPTISLTTNTSTNVSCNGGNNGTVTVHATGGTGILSYTLQPGSITNATGNYSGLTANTYTVTVTDAVGCTTSTTKVVSQPSLISWTSTNGSNVLCNGGNTGSINVSATGGTGTLTYSLLPGSASNTTGIFNNLNAQTYTVTVADANGCTKSTIILISQPTLLTWTSTSKTNVNCNGGSNGTINVVAAGGTGIINYTLQPGAVVSSTGVYAGLTAQAYTITAKDANNCTISTSITITQPTPLVIVSVTNTIPTCIPGNDATLTVMGSGGIINYVYNIGGLNQVSNVFNNLGAGTYTVKITDANGCTVTSVQSIIAPNAPSYNSATHNNVTCSGGNNGSINVTATGGTGTINYTLQPGAITNASGAFTSLTAQTYTITAADAVGCTISTIIAVTQPTQVAWTSTTSSNVSCNAGNNASINVSTSGGTGTITYTLQPGAVSNTSGTFATLTAQAYTITAKDANNCSISTVITITQPTPLTWTSTSSTNVSCNGGSNGTINVVASGGTGTINYILQPGAVVSSTGIYTGLTAQTYTITAKDANNCTKSTIITITQPTPLVIVSVTNTIPTCVPGNDANLTVTGSGGTIAYQYSIGGSNQISNVFTNLGAGTYTVKITDANGCTVTSVQSIIAPNAPSYSSATHNNVTCSGGNNGSIHVTATGGTGTINYTLQPGAVTNTTGAFTTLTAQTYTITAADAVGCTISTIITVTQPTQVAWTSTTSTNVSCNAGNNASINVTASGGTGTITYTLQPGAVSNTSGIFATLTAQAYTITAKDVNNCSISTVITITQPTPLTWTSTSSTNVSCNGGSNGTINVVAAGGTGSINYTLQPGAIVSATGSYTGLTAQTYTITAKDANNCTKSTIITITQPTPLVIVSVTNTIPTCVPGNDASLTVTGSGGTIAYQYSIGGPNQTSNVFNGLGAGTYTVKITDANGCTVTSVQSIIAPNAPSYNSATHNNVTCFGGNNGSIHVTATGGTGTINYSLQPGAITNASGAFTTLTVQTYTITAADAVGCTISTIIAVTQPTQVAWTSTTSTNVSCNAGNNASINVTASGGTGTITYTLQPGAVSNTSGTFATLTAQAYTITAKDVNNCSISTVITITQPTPLTWTSTTSTNVSCNGGSNGTINVVASGGTGTINYTLQPGAIVSATGSYTGLTAQTYTITAKDANNCTKSTIITITQPTPLVIVSVTNTIPTCVPGNDASLTVTGSGGTIAYQYSIGGPNQTSNVFNGLGAGTYTVKITDANGCTVTSVQSIIAPNAPSYSSATHNNVTCSGGNNGSIHVTATGGTGSINYTLQPGAVTNTSGAFTTLTAQTYTITAADAVGCTISTIIAVTQPTQVAWTSTTSTNVSCNAGNNASINVSASGGTGTITYTLQPGAVSNNSGTFATLTAQAYTITAKDVNNCSISTVITITQPTPLTWTSTTSTNVSCNGGSNGTINVVASGGTGTINYTLQPGAIVSATGSYTGLTAQTYTITAKDANNCTKTTSITITQPTPLLIVSVTNTIPTCIPGNDASLTVTGSGGTIAYQYSIGGPNQTSNVFNGLGAGTYTVKITDANGCTVTSVQSIIAPNAPSYNSATHNNVTCSGGNNGSINVTATGGTGTINYTLQPGAITNASGAFTSLTAQTYTITAADAVGCTISTIITVTQPTQVAWTSTTSTNVSCNAGNNASINVSASGGTGTITYTLQPGAVSNTSGTFATLTAQAYTITAKDVNNCSISTVITITQPTPLTWTSTTSTNVSCNGGSNGTINVVASGGTGTINYTLQPGAIVSATGSYTGLTAQTYTITAKDANNCTKTTSITITQPTPLVIVSVTNTIPTCVPGNDASLTVTGSGGTIAYQYSIGGPNQISNVFNGLGAGTYTVKITDANGCTVTYVQSIIAPNAPSYSSATHNNVTCFGGNNGSINVTATGGTGTINYTLQPGAVTNTTGAFTTLTAQTYTITAADAVGCTISTIIAVTQPTQVTWTSTTSTNVSCNAGNNASINVTASGGTGTITYTLQPGAVSNTSGTFATLTAQAYTITAKDVNNCSISTVITITQPTPLTWTSTTSTNVSCNGGSNGTISVVAAGGTGTINYTLQPGAVTNTSGSFATLNSQPYTITATDSNNCSITTVINITQPTPLTIISISSSIPSCIPGNDATMTIVANGGTTTYQYSIGAASQSSNVFNNLGAATYTVQVSDANGCTVTSAHAVISPNAPTFTSATNTNVLCNGGNNASINVSANGGTGAINYTLQPGNLTNASGSFGSLTAQTYTVTAIDIIGCSVSTTLVVTEPTQVAWTSTTSTNVSCNAGNNASINVSASGGTGTITYTLQPGAVSNTSGTFATLTAQAYTITAKDANNCSISTVIAITQPTPLTWTSTTSTNVSCNGGSNGTINVVANGGTGTINYTLQPGAVTNTSGSFATLNSQSYTITATDSNNCSISTVINITQPTPLTITSISSSIPSCIPGNDATMTIVANGGTTTYQYSIGAASQSSNVFNNLGPATYTVQVSDANGCTVTSVHAVISPNAPTFTSATNTNVLCNGGNNASINVTANGGTGAINYTLQPGNLTNASGSFGSLTAQTYTVTATDIIGCSVSTTLVVTEPTQVAWTSTTSTNVSCNAGNNASINVTASGGTGTITYTLQPGAVSNNSGTFATLTAQSYTITAKDANNCSISTVITITEPTPLTWTSTTSTNVSCNGGSNGIINVVANGGTGIINYTLQPGAVTNTSGSFATLNAQSYTITATDSNNCSITTVINITQPTPLSITSISSSIPSCIPGNDATMTIVANGGTTTYQYSIGAANQSSNVFTNLGPATYTVQVSDANGCTVTSVHAIITPNSPQISNLNVNGASCAPGNDGSITVTATSGTGAYSYSMDGITYQTSNVFSALAASTYTIIVKDASGCTGSSSTIVNTLSSPTITSVVTTQASCVPGCDAIATVTATGGSSGIYFYTLDNINFQTSSTFNSLCTNLYTVVVKDGNGCTANSSFPISTANGPAIANNTSGNVSCFGGNDGSIQFLANGGTGTINYVLQPIGTSNTSGVFPTLTAATYTVVATDVNGCTINTVVQISEPALLQFSSISSNGTLCSGAANGSLDAPTIGGTGLITYTINPAAPFVAPYSFTNLVGNTTYTITATDAHNCSVSATVFISQALAINIVSSSSGNVSCHGANDGLVNVSANGGTGALTYTLMPGAITNSSGSFNGLQGTIYTVTITDANNCTLTTTLTVVEPPAITLNNLTNTNISCHDFNDGQISISCNGGVGTLTYALQPGAVSNTSGSFNALNGNTYTILVTDATNCTYSTSTIISNPPVMVFDSLLASNALCFGDSNGTISVFVNGGTGAFTYSINPFPITNNTGLFNGLPAAVYTIHVKDINNCSIDTTHTILQPNAITSSIASTQDVTCFGGSNGACTINAAGGMPPFTYQLIPGAISNTSGIFTNLMAGNYTVQISDSNACTSSISPVMIFQPTQVHFTSVNHQDNICYGDTIGSITVDAAGGTGNISYSINPSNGSQLTPGSFSHLVAYVYTVVATDAAGCTATTTVEIIQNSALEFTRIDFKFPRCHGDQDGSISSDAIGGVPPLMFQLNGGAPVFTAYFNNLASGNYTLTVKDAMGCKKDTIVFLPEPDPVIAANVDITPISCNDVNNGKIIIDGQGGTGTLTYYLTPGLHINHTGIFNQLPTGVYHLVIKDSLGCKFDSSIHITKSIDAMDVAISKQDLSCFGNGNEAWAEATITGGQPPYSFEWSTNPPQFTSKIQDLFFGVYFLDVVDANGCSERDTVHILPGDCCEQVFIPNAFTPNGDGVNDVFKVTTSAGIELIQFAVYDRWGNKVWSSNNYRDAWDGSYNKQMENMDIFYYIFWYTCLTDGQKYMRKGDVMVVR